MKSTAELLVDHHGKRYVPLASICEEYLNVNYETANRYAAANRLGSLRAFKLKRSKKSPWLVDLIQLGEELDKLAIIARA